MSSTQLYVYGKEYGRFDVNVIKQHIAVAVVEKAFSLTNKEEIDEWMESDEIQALDWTIQNMLSGMVGTDYFIKGQREAMIERWKNDGAFNVEMEEYTFGVAKTAKEAKLEWVKLDSEEEGEDW